MTNRMGIYIHIPFCASKCSYCDFYSHTQGDFGLMDKYLKALQAHIKEAGAYTGGKGKGRWTADSIYFGGGTPVLFETGRIAAVLNSICSCWSVSKNAEITIECNPDSLDYKILKKLRNMGFNRISIGLQALQNELLVMLGRRHNAEQAADAVRAAKKANFDNISVDILYGLPGQTAAHLEQTLEAVLTWDIQHISFYGLKLEPSTPLYRSGIALPDDDEQAELYLYAVKLLENAGFEQYEISNFAKPSYHSRHNMKYWTLQPYMGFGPSAHSDFDGKRYSYVRSLTGYIDAIKSKDAVIDELETIDVLERSGEYVMCGLRTVRGISGNEYSSLFRVSFDELESKLERFQKLGLASRTADRWRLTPKGFLVSNKILTELLSGLVFSTK